MLSRRSHRGWQRSVLVLLLTCPPLMAGRATETIADPAGFLVQTEALRTRNHPLFVSRLRQIQQAWPALTEAQRWHLRYLDAWETMFEGDYATSQQQLQDIIRRSGIPALAAKSSALLLSNYGINRQYGQAFVLANELTSHLADITDPDARAQVLANLSQMFNLAGQSELALKYARMLVDTNPPGESLCYPLFSEIAALSNAHRVTSDSPELKQAIDTCVAAGQPVLTNSLWLIQGEHLLAEGKATAALAMLDRIAPAITTNRFRPHMISSQAQRAQAYERLGQNDNARKAALTAIGLGDKGDVNEWLRDAYLVLYRVAKKQGDASAALAYYEQYVAQDRGYLDDVSASALAFRLARQQVLTRQLETAELSKQNGILKLQQALDAKAMESSRLYIVLLLALLGSIAFWLYRLKRSQVRFKRLASHDGLTGILNHQHFIGECERILRVLEKHGEHAGLVSIDLDHFKQINDTYGHAMGDTVLRHAVAVCMEHLRPCDLFGRLGGEEFGVLLSDCNRDRALAIADRIRLAIVTNPLAIDGEIVTISASVGVAFTVNAGHDLQQLCREADAALYRAKRSGRNRVVADTEDGGLVSI